jgi:hypothetical protein
MSAVILPFSHTRSQSEEGQKACEALSIEHGNDYNSGDLF